MRPPLLCSACLGLRAVFLFVGVLGVCFRLGFPAELASSTLYQSTAIPCICILLPPHARDEPSLKRHHRLQENP